MNSEFGEYYEGSVLPCRTCEINAELNQHFTYEKLPTYGDGSNDCLIIGHSPKTRTKSKISMTLDLNREKNLYRYICNEVLVPLGLCIENCAATNLVKCFTKVPPEDIRMRDRKTTFMKTSFLYCKEHITKEIQLLNPKLIISLSQPASDILQTEFGQRRVPKPMKEIFGTMRSLDIQGVEYNWLPVVHIPKGKQRSYYFPEQTNRLENLRSEVARIVKK